MLQSLRSLNPRFANYRNWLSSDYMLNALQIDPATTQKRLGDGFYEQRLIREQIAALSGQRFLGDFSSDEQQYTALMNSAVTQASSLQLRPGIALSASQMAALTSDIVWLIEQTVTLPDGTVTRALVPQVYIRPRAGDLDGTGTLIAARNIKLQVTGDVVNSGTIGSRQVTLIDANNLRNLGGTIAGNQVGIKATQDIDNIGGSIVAGERMVLNAGRDINLTTTTATGEGSTSSTTGRGKRARSSQTEASITQTDRVAGLYVTGADGKAGVLVANAGRDINMQAAIISNTGAASQSVTDAQGQTSTERSITALNAGRDINSSTVSTGISIAGTSTGRRRQLQHQPPRQTRHRQPIAGHRRPSTDRRAKHHHPSSAQIQAKVATSASKPAKTSKSKKAAETSNSNPNPKPAAEAC
ncbi:MAG: S-layer family protein [Brachymonas sp.]|nr:S-layer family protein [Brachymonas sp.]